MAILVPFYFISPSLNDYPSDGCFCFDYRESQDIKIIGKVEEIIFPGGLKNKRALEA